MTNFITKPFSSHCVTMQTFFIWPPVACLFRLYFFLVGDSTNLEPDSRRSRKLRCTLRNVSPLGNELFSYSAKIPWWLATQMWLLCRPIKTPYSLVLCIFSVTWEGFVNLAWFPVEVFVRKDFLRNRTYSRIHEIYLETSCFAASLCRLFVRSFCLTFQYL